MCSLDVCILSHLGDRKIYPDGCQRTRIHNKQLATYFAGQWVEGSLFISAESLTRKKEIPSPKRESNP